MKSTFMAGWVMKFTSWWGGVAHEIHIHDRVGLGGRDMGVSLSVHMWPTAVLFSN